MPQVRKVAAVDGQPPADWKEDEKRANRWQEIRQQIAGVAAGDWYVIEPTEGDPEDLFTQLARMLRHDAKVRGEALRIQRSGKVRPVMYVQRIAKLVVAPTVEPTPAQARRVPALRRRLMRRSEAST